MIFPANKDLFPLSIKIICLNALCKLGQSVVKVMSDAFEW